MTEARCLKHAPIRRRGFECLQNIAWTKTAGSYRAGFPPNKRTLFGLMILLGCGLAVHDKGPSIQSKRRTTYSTVTFDATHLPHPTVHSTNGSTIRPAWAEEVNRECDSLFYPNTELPYFNTASELERCPQWMSYLSRIYGLETLTYPVDIANFTFFYGDHPALSKHTHHVKEKNSSHFGELFRVSLAPWKNDANGNKKELWMRHVHGTREASNFNNLHLYMEEESNTGTEATMGSMDSDAYLARLDILLQVPDEKNRWKPFFFANYSKVEVFHECCDPPGTGFWFALAPGSGVFYDVGRSQVFRTHRDACLFYGNQSCSFDIVSMLSFVKDSARKNGFDSLQFTDHWPGGSVSVYEIWDIRESLEQQTACPPKHLDENCSDCVQKFLFSGWKAVHRCICDTQEGRLLTCTAPRKQPINLTIAVTGKI